MFTVVDKNDKILLETLSYEVARKLVQSRKTQGQQAYINLNGVPYDPDFN